MGGGLGWSEEDSVEPKTKSWYKGGAESEETTQ